MGGGTKETKQTTEPWKVAQPYYKDLYASAKSAFDQTNNKPYGGETLAQPQIAQRQAVDQVKQLAPTLSAGADPMRQLALSQIRGDWLSPDTNPYIKDVASAAIDPLQKSLDRNLLSIKDRSIASGAYGGARQDLQENSAVDDFTKSAGNVTSNIFAQNFANERGIQQNSGQLLELANALSLAGPTALANAGDVEQGWEQATLDDQLAKFMRDKQAPWEGIGEMANILNAGGFSTGTTTEPKPSPLIGMLQGLMGGASTGASLASGIGGVAAGAGLGAFAPWMLPLGLLGGLAGGLS